VTGLAPLAALLLGAAPAAPPAAPAAPVRAGGAEQAAAVIGAPALRAHVRFLSSDLLEGRLPGTRGDALARAYVAAQLEALGLEPAAPDGGWFQAVALDGVRSRVEGALTARGPGGAALSLAPVEDVMVVAGQARERTGWTDAELVFVG